jgi:hypothetical protein
VTEERRGAESSESAPRDHVERWLRVFVEDSALWPILVAAVGIFACFGAALLVLAFEDRNLGALVGVALLAALALHGLAGALRRRRLGALGGIALAVALLSLLGALAHHFFLAS